MDGRRTISDVLGLRFAPPAGAMRALRWSRRRLSGALRRTAPPPLAIQEALAGLYDNRVLGLLVELGIPDELDGPITAGVLAERCGADARALDRVLRYAATRGFVTALRGGRYGPSPVSQFLRTDRRDSWAPMVDRATSEWFWAAWRDLDVRIGATGPKAEIEGTDPNVVGTLVQAVALSRELSWTDVAVVCDVGGGSGAALEVLLTDHGHLTGILFDRPEVVAAPAQALTVPPLSGRCELVGGDFLDHVPAGADRYLLMAVMTESDDDRAVALLSRIRAAMEPGARVLVVDNELSEHPREEYAQLSDLMLLVLEVGRERTRREYERIFSAAGLQIVAAPLLLTGSTAFELSVAGAGD